MIALALPVLGSSFPLPAQHRARHARPPRRWRDVLAGFALAVLAALDGPAVLGALADGARYV